jgi:RNA methyltransferase, TrmH family
MMALSKLSRLHGIALERKCALLLEVVEREIAAASERGEGVPVDRDVASPESFQEGFAYAAGIAAFLAASPEASPEAAAAARAFSTAMDGASLSGATASRAAGWASGSGSAALRALNGFRHALRKASGQSTADWDLVDHERQVEDGSGVMFGAGGGRGRFVPGLRVFLEDIRSPFNVGAIMRTAEALGFEELLLSPGCADPRHTRASRSSMGAVDLLPWRRATLGELRSLGSPVALELGGTPLQDFAFPPRGILILGSEELGVSEPALALAGSNRVSIPLMGVKASINVAVAFGIAAQAWISSAAGASIARRPPVAAQIPR